MPPGRVGDAALGVGRTGIGGWRSGGGTGKVGDVATPFRLHAGDTGPVQQSPVTCGSACLTVARMLVDPLFASWVRTGRPNPPGSPPGDTEAERFAAYERVVMRRTNGLLAGPGRVNLPWPRALGTPPWGAKRELEFGAAATGTLYDVVALRPLSGRSLRSAFECLVDVVAEGEPALLYIGNARLPLSRGARPCPVTVTASSTSTTPAPAGSATCGATPSSSTTWDSAGGTSRGSSCSRPATGGSARMRRSARWVGCGHPQTPDASRRSTPRVRSSSADR